MHKAWLVAKHEFITNVSKRSFLFAAFGIPLVFVILIVIVSLIAIDAEENLDRLGMIGYVDQAGVLAEPRDVPAGFSAFPDVEAAETALESGAIGAYFVVRADYLQTGSVALVSRSGTPSALKSTFDAFLLSNLSRDLDPALAQRIIEPVDMTVRILDSGRELTSAAAPALLIVPFVFVFLFMIASQSASAYLMSGVVEEKSNRIMEILITSVSPMQLLAGKIVGLGALGLVQIGIWLIVGFLALQFGQNIELLAGIQLPLDLVVIGLIFFLLGYFLLAGIMAGIGAVLGSEQESRQWAGILSLITVIPFFFIISFITDPNGPIVTFLSLFPFTAPVAVILRVGFGAMPMWQLLLSTGLLIATVIVVMWASARIFRWSLLLYGKRPTPRELLRVLRAPVPMATSAASGGDNL